ncbi:hypothetical protein U8P68_10745 [Rhizobium ruizarguesonis]|jgi:hypothetical protein|uniref:hypothetical protein n=1 Tax=Rhizobium leguminosarum TaxID=384 RepID=UPI001031E25A|nr:hypothetical protein [Rhizobium leguminosarum]TBE54444.1 hypothetical protein ELH04_08495 [Rhizobium leguminosarum]WSH59796.1 hypothetical protein U8P68_10745 [Rhizobium ruizarguesonis]
MNPRTQIDLRRSTAARLLQAAERDGFVVDRTPQERQACLRLNGHGLLRRDRKLASRWYPVETAPASEARP